MLPRECQNCVTKGVSTVFNSGEKIDIIAENTNIFGPKFSTLTLHRSKSSWGVFLRERFNFAGNECNLLQNAF